MQFSLRNALKFNVAPARERGLKFGYISEGIKDLTRRSREGAWIEIVFAVGTNGRGNGVAPARERGLKCESEH